MRVFIGYDKNETVAYHVLAHSIHRHASKPVAITPLVLSQLPLKRQRSVFQSTDFSFSRFLVPWLCDYQGQAVFLDCDMLVRSDITELLEYLDGSDVQVVKHDYRPSTESKFLNQVQSRYEKKNWSSVMLFDNAKCRTLTPEAVDSETGLYLHQFKWASEVGNLPVAWNHLVTEYPYNPHAKLVHYTLGTPCFAKYANCDYADEWRAEKSLMLSYNAAGEFRKEKVA